MNDNIKIRVIQDSPLSLNVLQEKSHVVKLIETYSGSAKVSVDTTEGWNLKPTYIPKSGEIVVYSDATVLEKKYPAIKIGDGSAYVVDLPFLGEENVNTLFEHIANSDMHVTPEEKALWNNKVNCDISGEQLIFTTS